MIDDLIKRLEEYLEILKFTRDHEDEILSSLEKVSATDVYYRNISEIYVSVEKIQKRMNTLRQLRLFAKRR